VLGFSAFLGFLVINKLFLEADRILNPQFPALAIVKYVLLEAPNYCTWALPVAMLFSTLMSMGRLGKDNELTAMFTNGISLYRVFIPYLLLSLIAVGGSYFAQEKLVTLAAAAQQRILDAHPEIRMSQESGTLRPFIAKLDNGDFVTATYFDKKAGMLANVVYDDWGNDALKSQHAGAAAQDADETKAAEALTAAEGGATFVTAQQATAKGETVVMGQGGRSPAYVYGSPDPEKLYSRHYSEPTKVLNLGLDLKEQFTQMKTPQELTQTELAEQRAVKLRRGENPAIEDTDFHLRFSGPFAPLAFALVAMPLSLKAPRDERFLGIIWTVLLAMLYYTIYYVGKQLGYNEYLPPWLAAWMMNIVLVAISFTIFAFSRK
jgi:lipopolysaccharide export system permease protein